jgi:hypothetical protein
MALISLRNGVSKIVFIPYAAHDHDAYEKKVKEAFSEFGNKKKTFNIFFICKIYSLIYLFLQGWSSIAFTNQTIYCQLFKKLRAFLLEEEILSCYLKHSMI